MTRQMSGELWRDPVVRELIDWRETVECYLHDLELDVERLQPDGGSRLTPETRLALRLKIGEARAAIEDAGRVVQLAFDRAS